MNEVYEDTINYLKYYGEKNHRKIENIAYFLDCELKNYIKLQSNWNSLREWVQKHYDEYKDMEQDAMFEFGLMLDKMNELEGADNDKNIK